MKNDIERRLMRWLHGEASAEEGQHLEALLRENPEARAAHEELAKTWQGLAKPPATDLPADFTAKVMTAARQVRKDELSWSLAPSWARAASSAALVIGLISGLGVGGSLEQTEVLEDIEIYSDADSVPLSLAESYWLALEEDIEPSESEAESHS